ncbi:hypothetical protein AB5J62_28965 [Amycolatopsis sp. cg5]|uniref:hypothetical protein n=1 Tax=Amycolatopsis sp. cg5 TaxID=3238802 RepID=UPI003524007C
MNRKRALVAAGALIAVAAFAAAGISSHLREKDRRDLHDLTRSSPWPRAELLVPDGMPHSTGSIDNQGFALSFDLNGVPFNYAIRKLERENTFAFSGGVDCGATAVVRCTDLGDGFIRMDAPKIGEGQASVNLYRPAGDRIFGVQAFGTTADVTALKGMLTRLHRPSDEELLDLIRPDGYQTDWS